VVDNQFVLPRSTLELLERVPESLLRRLKQYSGRLATEAVSAMQDRLPFFAGLEASQRASVALVVQTAVVNFVEWMQDPRSDVSYTAQAFELVPQDLTRRIALRHSVDMVRVTMEFFEEVVPMLARDEEQLTALMVGILKYSRDLAFTAASSYANAAEARGTWDSRMEASVVDAVVRGDTGPELLSRAAALNWDTTAPATVVVGTPAPARTGPDGQEASEKASQDVRNVATRHGRAALTDVHGTWLVAIVSGHLSPTEKFLNDLLDAFSDGPVVIGPTAPMLTGAYHISSEAISGMNAVA
jgi:DNA-binding PucR family transcriptional regulator